MEYKHVKPDESVNVTRKHPLQEFATYSLSIITLLAIIYYLSAIAVDYMVQYVDNNTEKWIWDNFLQSEYLEEKSDPSLIKEQNKLQAILDKIPKNDLPKNNYKILLFRAADVNALALPSGKIVIYTGLLEKIKSENGIVFIIGHELGHFANRDHLRGMGRSIITSLILAPLSSDLPSIFHGVAGSFDMKFSREQENKADEYGLKVLHEYYGHAGGATEFFEYIRDNNELAELLTYGSTHPQSSSRIRNLKNIIKDKHITINNVEPYRFDFDRHNTKIDN